MDGWMDGRMDEKHPRESSERPVKGGGPENKERGGCPPGVERRGPRAAAEMPPVSGDRPLTRNGKVVKMARDGKRFSREKAEENRLWRNLF